MSVDTMASAGIAAMIAFHMFVNIGMTVRLMPVTGLPRSTLSEGSMMQSKRVDRSMGRAARSGGAVGAAVFGIATALMNLFFYLAIDRIEDRSGQPPRFGDRHVQHREGLARGHAVAELGQQVLVRLERVVPRGEVHEQGDPGIEDPAQLVVRGSLADRARILGGEEAAGLHPVGLGDRLRIGCPHRTTGRLCVCSPARLTQRRCTPANPSRAKGQARHLLLHGRRAKPLLGSHTLESLRLR